MIAHVGIDDLAPENREAVDRDVVEPELGCPRGNGGLAFRDVIAGSDKRWLRDRGRNVQVAQ